MASKIHPVFHVSILKPFSGLGQEVVANLLEEELDGHPVEKPLVICDTRIILQKGIPVRQVLVQWSGRAPEEATWEWLSEFKIAYPSYHLEDKVLFKDEGNDTPGSKLNEEPLPGPKPMTEPRPKRKSSRPVWHKDYVTK